MSRGLIALDRVVLLLLGVAVLLASVATIVWGLDRWPPDPSPLAVPQEVDLAGLGGLAEEPWWPWALGVGGAVAVVVGLRSLLAHARRRRVRQVALPSTATAPGRLRLDLPGLAGAAAEALRAHGAVEAARGHVVVDRGATVVELLARVDAATDLAALRRSIDTTRDELARSLPAGVAQVRVRVDARRSRVDNPRVT